MPARSDLATPKDAPVAARSPRAPDAATQRGTTGSPLALPPTPIPRELHRVERPAAEPPDLLGRRRSPLLQPSLILQLQQVQGNRHVTRMLAQPVIARADPAPAAPAGETAPAAPEGAAPEPVTPEAASLAQTQAVLNQSFGKTKPIEIPPGEIYLLDDQEATWAKYDRFMKGQPNPFNDDQPWTDGDAKKYSPGLTAFYHWGTIFVNKQQPLGTAVVHELLHANEADGFGDAVGRALREGATQYLTITALNAAHIPLDEGLFYPMETSWVHRLIALLGEDTTLINAYFLGADTLIAKVDALKGAGSFAKLKDALARLDQDYAQADRDEARKILEPTPAALAPGAPAPQP
jgi:hypothetical protein